MELFRLLVKGAGLASKNQPSSAKYLMVRTIWLV